eukprot:6101829-Pleurochrysis_carterae.AAC.3
MQCKQTGQENAFASVSCGSVGIGARSSVNFPQAGKRARRNKRTDNVGAKRWARGHVRRQMRKAARKPEDHIKTMVKMLQRGRKSRSAACSI